MEDEKSRGNRNQIEKARTKISKEPLSSFFQLRVIPVISLLLY